MGAALRGRAADAGWRVTTPALDVTSDDSVAAATAAILGETGGRLDVLVNNAGYYQFGALEETTPDELRAQFETNVVGVHRVTRAVLPAMRARRGGTIVTLGSVSGRVAVPMVAPYHASKWALEGMIEALRLELIPFGIRVVLIEPGPYRTMLHDNERLAAGRRRGRQPLRRAAGELPAPGGQAAARGRSGAADRRDRARRDQRKPPSALAGWADVADRRPAARVRPDRLYEWLMRIGVPDPSEAVNAADRRAIIEAAVPSDKLTRREVEFVLRRAAEIDTQSPTRNERATDETLSVGELVRLGEEAGLRGEAVQQALTELRRGAPLEPEENGTLARTLGASRVVVSRVVAAPIDVVRRAVDRFLREQLMTVRRHHGDRIEWERAQGIWPGLVRSLDFSKRYAFSLVSRVETILSQEGGTKTAVTFNIDLSEMRRERLAQMGLRAAMAFALLGLGGAAMVPVSASTTSSRSRAAAWPPAASSPSSAGATWKAGAASRWPPSVSSTCLPSASSAARPAGRQSARRLARGYPQSTPARCSRSERRGSEAVFVDGIARLAAARDGRDPCSSCPPARAPSPARRGRSNPCDVGDQRTSL